MPIQNIGLFNVQTLFKYLHVNISRYVYGNDYV